MGMATSLSLPPFNFFLINFLTFSFFFIFLVKKSRSQFNKLLFFFYGWFFGFGFFVTNLYWVSISLTFDESFKFLIPLSLIFLPAFLAIFYGIIAYLFLILKTKKIISSFLIFSAIYGTFEFVRGFVLTGFPWNLIVFSLSKNLEILSILSVVGTYGLNLLCISIFTSGGLFVLRESKKDVVIGIFFILTPLFFYSYGLFYKNEFFNSKVITYDYKIRSIGSNISLDRFYENIDITSVIDDLINISDPQINEKTIFLWPEGILPGIFQEQLVDYKSFFKNRLSENHFLGLGINSQQNDQGFQKFYNSFSLYDNEFNLLDSYNKINLVPFGEFLPFESILKKIGFKSITNNYESFSTGSKRNIIPIVKDNFSLKILPLICYEIIYSGKLYSNQEFDVLVNISEDGWFGKSIGPKQHFTHSIFRAIESGKYVIRSSNNGSAAIINPLGIVEKKVDFGKSGYVDFEERREIQSTIFSSYGNKIFGIIILLYIFFILIFNKVGHD